MEGAREVSPATLVDISFSKDPSEKTEEGALQIISSSVDDNINISKWREVGSGADFTQGKGRPQPSDLTASGAGA